ncbi:hypothetical protein TNCV_742151 [Trichonephila clavipes]|nr:hypothetical protein TNCV_742151 [Trichonephila clavipes]
MQGTERLLTKFLNSNEEEYFPYKECRLSVREIEKRAGRNQAAVIRNCHRWKQKKRRTNGTDRNHLVASLSVMRSGLCA